MPIYEYECAECKQHHEIMQKITEKPLKKCPFCDGKLKKLISNTSFVLKGTGWYATDYASGKHKSEGADPKAGRGESKTEKTESKTEQKKDVKTGEKSAPEAAVSK